MWKATIEVVAVTRLQNLFLVTDGDFDHSGKDHACLLCRMRKLFAGVSPGCIALV